MEATVEVKAITRADLLSAFTEWETSFRAGQCMPAAESAALPVEAVAALNMAHFWDRLK